MSAEPHELFEGMNLREVVEELDLPKATRDFLRNDLEAWAPENDHEDSFWTYWEHIPDEHCAALNRAEQKKAAE
jgi:hypothetical protein